MAENDNINKVGSIFGGVEFNNAQGEIQTELQTEATQEKDTQAKVEGQEVEEEIFKTFETTENLPAKPSIWAKIRGALLTNISFKIEFTPHQQKTENKLSVFLRQWSSFKKVFKRKNKFSEENKNL